MTVYCLIIVKQLPSQEALQSKEIAFINYTVVILWSAECCSDDCVLSHYRQTAPLAGSCIQILTQPL